jgi:hypothetical protein
MKNTNTTLADVFYGQKVLHSMEAELEHSQKEVFGDSLLAIAGQPMMVIGETRKNTRKIMAGSGSQGDRAALADPLLEEEQLQHYVHAAFCFVCALLWNGEQWSDSEVRKALGDLEIFFTHTQDQEGTFVTLARRAILANILGGKLDRMRLWSALMHPSGLASEPLIGYTRKQEKAFVENNRVFTVGLPILVKYYLDYVAEPSADKIMALKVELDDVEFGELMQIFFEVINAREPGV